MFFEKNINKKRKFLISLIFVFVFASLAGVFYFQNREIKGNPDDYVIIETEQGTIVENKRAGLSMKVPDGWEVRKIEVMEGSVVFYSPDAEGLNPDKIRPPLQKGCMIEAAIVYKKMNFEEIRARVEEIHEGFLIELEEFEEIKINNYQALRNKFECQLLNYGEALYISINNNLYSFCIYSSLEDTNKEVCVQEFDEFLKGVSIK